LQETAEVKTDAELKAKLEAYISQYKKDLFSKAATEYEENGYSAAVKLLGDGENLLKNDTELKEKIAYYNNKKPVSLSMLSTYKYELGYKAEEIIDICGNRYTEKFYRNTYTATFDLGVFFLGEEYEVFKCKLVLLPSGGGGTSIEITNFETKEVLFSRTIKDTDVEGINVEIDVSHVKLLGIEIGGSAPMVNAQLIKK